LLDDELDERNFAAVTNTRTLIWDVRDLDAPVYFADYIGLANSIDHNQYIVGNYAYQANYQSGLRILDISDIANGNLSEAGFFDIYPSSDSPNFNGAWSVYPFFASGNVVVSGIEQGLYILRPNLGTSNDPPQVSIISPADGGPALSGNVPVRIDATDTEDAAGTLTVEWNMDGGTWQAATWDGSGYTASLDTTSVLDGAHVVNARAIDSGLSEGSDASNVTVLNGGPEFTVDAINVIIRVGKGNRNIGEAVVTVTDVVGSPLDGVAIYGTFSGGSAFGTVAGHVTDVVIGSGITNAAVSTDTGQATNTDAFGVYSMANVPVGNRTVSVTASSYESQNASASVTENNTTIVDFPLSETVTGGSGSIKGTVDSSAGGKLAGVTVQVLGGSSSLTNKGGKYTIQNVPEGLQTVTASKTGFLSQQKDVNVAAGGSMTLNFTLAPK
jgi:hypothetical protein